MKRLWLLCLLIALPAHAGFFISPQSGGTPAGVNNDIQINANGVFGTGGANSTIPTPAVGDLACAASSTAWQSIAAAASPNILVANGASACPVYGVLPGTATNDNAAAGKVGEIISGSLAVGSATALTTATAKDIATVSLTAGDWDCSGVIDFAPAATTNTTLLLFGSSSTLNTLGADDTYGSVVFLTAGQVTTNGNYRNSIPTQRFSLSGTTTIHLVAQATFTASTMTGYGTIRCRRVR